MNIAMVDPSLFTIPYDCELVHALATAGDPGGAHAVTLYGRALRAGEALSRPIRLVAQFYGASERLPGPVRRAAKGVEHALDLSLFAMRMRRARPDIIHFQWCPLPLLDAAGLALLRRLAPLVLTVHDPNPYNGSENRLMRRGARQLPSLFDAVIVHSDWGRAQLARNGIDPARLHVVPHGPLPVTRSGRAAEAGSGRFTIVFFGKIKPYKGLDTLVAALAKLPDDLRRHIHLIVAGQPAMEIGDIRARAAAAGLSTTWELRFIPDDEIDRWLSPADLFVFPYRDIDASGVFMCCLKYGKPIIASRIGMFGTALEQGVHGYLVDPGQGAEAFTAAIAAVMSDRAMAHRMGMAVGRLTDSLPSWAGIARSTAALYAEVRDGWDKAMAPAA